MGLLGPVSAPAVGAFAPQTGAKQQTSPGLSVAVAASTRAVPEVRRDGYVFAPAATSAAAFASLEDAGNANDREAEAALAASLSDDAPAALPLPPPRRYESDPAAHFIPEPKPLVGPAPARIPLLGFAVATNPALDEAARSAQAEQAYSGQQKLDTDALDDAATSRDVADPTWAEPPPAT